MATPTLPLSSAPNKILWKVILYHPLNVHWTVKPPHWKQNKGIEDRRRERDGGGGRRRRIIILCRPSVLTQTPSLSAAPGGKRKGQTFSVNWHFVSSEPSLCERWRGWKMGGKRERDRERKPVLVLAGPCWGYLRFTSYPLLIGLSLLYGEKETGRERRIHLTPTLPPMCPPKQEGKRRARVQKDA